MNRKYRKTIIAGNWKMNKTITELRAFANELRPIIPKQKWCEVALLVPSVSLSPAYRMLRPLRIHSGAQNIHYESSGPYTGEISALMVQDTNAKYVLAGHSERREYFGETDFDVSKKVQAILHAGLHPILCVGEGQEHRERGLTEELISYQIKTALCDLVSTQMRKLVIAYEPVWAIGTGKTATPDMAQEVVFFIRTLIRKRFGARIARGLSILYGGSMNGDNAAALLACPDIDGGLIGGASLRPQDFVQIIHAAKSGEEPEDDGGDSDEDFPDMDDAFGNEEERP